MPKSPVLFLLLTATLLTGCFVERSYVVSPFNGNASKYHTIPLRSDSMPSAFYAQGALALGGANQQGRDAVVALHGGVSGGHNFSFFQAFYSLGFTAGNYKIGSWSGRVQKENKFFGGAGIEGGLNIVIPFGRDEWRLVGIETAWHQEWGDYLQYRKRLNVSDVDVLVTNKNFHTLGGYTEYIARIQHIALGFRLGAGTVLGRRYQNIVIDNAWEGDRLNFRYYNFTMHLSQKRYTAYIRTNFATRASSALFGINYRLGKK